MRSLSPLTWKKYVYAEKRRAFILACLYSCFDPKIIRKEWGKFQGDDIFIETELLNDTQ